MPINFHDSKNKSTYAKREAESCWIDNIKKHVEVIGKEVLDIGCGGGIYSKVFAQSEAKHVTGLDFSEEMLKMAKENCKNIKNISFKQGSAFETGIKEETFDIVLERALIHHIKDLQSCFKEANRVLKPQGKLIIQDRTPTDCSLPGSITHIRGFFFERYPKLLEKELNRRYTSKQVVSIMNESGFKLINEQKIWETRKSYSHFMQLKLDLMGRTGRSILHELTDDELKDLVHYIEQKIGREEKLIEEDRWTVWIAEKL
ncbi:class I SAM-dependent methyltransferase [Caldalkalibacillus salinus]|uniref:class I SAM-dependent methyltransferase n=1 Tax=Caldalkalibacillus salinus TaxID=2803787 RepID=UPI0019244D6B|nr:class I SAM-dependent methyltransferase [Caldalkalibacillus salinus]